MNGAKGVQLSCFAEMGSVWSGRGDLNPRPPEPHSGTLPGCATARLLAMLSRQSCGPENKVLGHFDISRRRDDLDLFDLARLRRQLFAARFEFFVPGALDLRDLFEVVGFAHRLRRVSDGSSRPSARDVVERLSPRHVVG